MKRKQIEYLFNRLLEEKDDLLKVIDGFERQGIHENMNDTSGELSAYDNHPADYGSQLAARQTDYGLLELANHQLNAVNHALDRMQAGSYGVCELCNQQIPEDRLDALPYATKCLSCKEMLEEKESLNENEQEFSFCRSFKDDQDYTGFDGEDTWQAVARWGTANSPQDEHGALTYDDTYLDADELIGAVTEIETIRRQSRKYLPDERMD